MTLANDIASFRESFLSTLPECVADSLAEGVEEMMASYTQDAPLQEGRTGGTA